MTNLTDQITIESAEPVLVPHRLVGLAVQRQIEEIMAIRRDTWVTMDIESLIRGVINSDDPEEAIARAKRQWIPNAVNGWHTAYGDWLFYWNDSTGVHEIRESATGNIVFHSERRGRRITLCTIDPMRLERVCEELREK